MSWLNGSWKFRQPIAVYNSGVTGTNDWTAVIPDTFEHIFANTMSAGEDVRLCAADGVTPKTVDLLTFSTTNRTGTIECDNDTVQGAATSLRWLYYGNSGATTGLTSFAPASPLTGSLSMDSPATWVMRCAPESAGATKPSFKVAKKSTENIDVYLDLTDVLIKRYDTNRSSTSYEEVAYMEVTGRTANATDNTILTAASHRFVLAGERFYAVVRLTAGATGTDYTVLVKITTTLSPTARVLDYRFWLQVRDVDED